MGIRQTRKVRLKIILLEWESSDVPSPENLTSGIEIDTVILASGNFGIITRPLTGGNIYVSGQQVFIAASTDINLKGRTVFANNRNNIAPIKIVPANQSPSSTEEGELIMSPAGPRPDGGIGQLFLDTGSGIAPFVTASGFFFAYDNIIGNDGVRIGAAATIIGFNTEVIKDRQFMHVLNAAASGIIAVTNNGIYRTIYNASFTKIDTGTTTPTQVKAQLYINNVAYGPSVSYDINANNTNNIMTCNALTYVVLKAGDQITLKANKITNTGSTVRTNNNECWIIMEKIR